MRAASAPASRAISSWRRRAAVERTPGLTRLPPPRGLLVADEGVEHVELVGGPGEPPLLELARHRDQPLRRGREILARDRPSPRVRPRAAVGEDAPGEDEARLVLRPQLGERLELAVVEEPVGHVELGLDVRLLRRRADGGRIALDAEEEPDRLGEDRLAGAGLAAEDVEARLPARARPHG